jgi:hypothetical protein
MDVAIGIVTTGTAIMAAAGVGTTITIVDMAMVAVTVAPGDDRAGALPILTSGFPHEAEAKKTPTGYLRRAFFH